MKRKAYSREEREVQIQTAFCIELQRGNDGSMTSAMIAKHLEIAASTKLNIILADMVNERKLVMYREPMPGIAGFRRVYALHPDNLYRISPQAAQRRREIRINPNRKQAQMELFL